MPRCMVLKQEAGMGAGKRLAIKATFPQSERRETRFHTLVRSPAPEQELRGIHGEWPSLHKGYGLRFPCVLERSFVLACNNSVKGAS